MTTRNVIYDFLSDNGSDLETSRRNSRIVMDLLHDNRPVVYEMLEDILQSDNLVRATETDKNPTLEQELLFICPSLAHMPRVLASVVRMVECNLEDPDDPNSEPMIDPVLTRQLLQIDRALSDRKTQIANLEESSEMLDLCREHAKYSFEAANWDFKALTRKEKQIFKDRPTWARFRRWAQK